MRRSILITMENMGWPEIDFALYLYDPDEKGKIAPKIQRRSLYDTALPNCEVHALNAMREIVSDLIRDGKETTNYARQSPQSREAWQERQESDGRVRERNLAQRKQKRPQGHVTTSGRRDRVFSTAKGKAKSKVRKRA